MTTVYVDGGCSGNPGPMTGGVIIVDGDGVVFSSRAYKFGFGTNNKAEYFALREALIDLRKHQLLSDIDIMMDSALVVNQVNGLWKCKDAELRDLRDAILDLRVGFVNLRLIQIPRAQNLADRLT